MKDVAISVLVIAILAPAEIRGQTPTAGFVSPGPGLNAPFAFSASVDTYGKERLIAGWAFIDGAGTPVSLNPIARYFTSLENDNGTVTPMSTSEDWVLSFSYGINDNLFADNIVLYTRAKESTPEERNIFALRREANSVILQMGDFSQGNDSWLDIPGAAPIDMTPSPDGKMYHDFVVRFKSSSSSLDAYVDDELVASDFTLAHGDYAIEYVQLNPGGPELDDLQKDRFRLLKIGQSVPPAPDNADFDGNGLVDGKDFLIWQRNFGTVGTTSRGDANADFLINREDLDSWAAQYGMHNALAAVPEPTSLILAMSIVGAASLLFNVRSV